MDITSFVPLQSSNVSATSVVETVHRLLTRSHSERELNHVPCEPTSSGGFESESHSLPAPVGSSFNEKRQPELTSSKAHDGKSAGGGANHSTSSSSVLPSSGKNPDSSSRKVGRFTSKRVRLPATVEDLVSSYEVLYEQHEAQKALLDTLYKEVGRLAENDSPPARMSLRNVRRIGSRSPEVAAGAPLVNATPAIGCALSVEQTPAVHSAGSDDPVVGGVVFGRVVPIKEVSTSSVKGNVVEAAVVLPREQPKPLEASNGRFASSQGGEGCVSANSTSEGSEKVNVMLQAKVLAMEAAQHLLASTQIQVQQQVQERHRLEEDLIEAREQLHMIQEENAALRSAFQSQQIDGNGLASLGVEEAQHLMTLLQSSASSAHTLKDELKLMKETIDCVEYRESQLKVQLETLQTQNAFFNEKSMQLEGQLHRLLSRDFMCEINQIPLPSSVRPNQGGANMSIGVGGNGWGQPSPGTVPQLTPLERYNTETLQRQINELRTIVDRLQQSNTKHEATRTNMESHLRALTKENGTLKQNLLEYRSKLNNMELNLENDESLRTYEERCRSAEKEALRLRQVLNERKGKYDSQVCELKRRIDRLEVRDGLYGRATTRLLTQNVSATIQRLADDELSRQAGRRETSPRAPEGREGMGPAKEVVRETSSMAPDAPSTLARESVPQSSPATAGNRAEIRRLEQLNRELRQALARSQEELQTKARLLDRAHRTASNNSLGGNTSYRALSLRQDPSTLIELCSVGDASLNEAPRRDASVRCELTHQGCADLSLEEASHMLTEIEQRYNPERLDSFEAVKLENSALLLRLSILQQEKWTSASQIEALQSNCAALREDLQRVMSSKKGLPQAEAAVGPLRGLQSLLQTTLSEKLKLEETIKILQSQTHYSLSNTN
ncbi:unnamed protein product [Phytomonas sp. Hart1]|nr:unnamed protein product [Phytomonas sp. Hart1]|eukprot:CCW70859.1 unnamed protein product [Phytomonas sp. isolate Hart1]